MNLRFSSPFVLAAAFGVGMHATGDSLMAQSQSNSLNSPKCPPPAVSMSRTAPQTPPPAVTSERTGTKGAAVQSQPEQPMTVYSHGDPTAEEQYVLELINRARANPAAEGDRLSTTTDADVTNSYNFFGTPSRSTVKSDFATYPVQPPLAFNDKLITAARGHSNWMLANNVQDHYEGSVSPFDRMNNAGYTGWTGAGENIFAYGNSLWHIHASFNIDFGNDATLGHRQNIMNFTGSVFREVGIGIIHGGSGGGGMGPLVTTEDFGTRSQTFLLGVVYDDKNKNGMYDVGEGLAGVTIKPSSGSYTAVTSTSGGYAIPFSGSGSVTVTGSAGALTTAVTKTVTFSGENVKIDFNPDNSGMPSLAIPVTPSADTTINTASLKLIWNKALLATKYHVQVASDTAFKTIVVDDANVTDTTKTVSGLKDGSVYYWHVQAVNAKGSSSYSQRIKLNVVLPPQAVTTILPASNATVDVGGVLFRWNASTPRVQSYTFELSKSSTMTPLIISNSNVTDTTLTVDGTNFQPGSTYYWRVRAQNDGGLSAGSVNSFTVTSAGVTGEQTAALSVTVSPNPSMGDGVAAPRFHFGLAESAEVDLRIVSMTGEEVAHVSLGRLGVGDHDYTWNPGSIAAGSYFYQLLLGDRVASGRIVIVR